MKLFDLKKRIKQLAQSLPDIHTIIDGDVYQLNELPNVDYSAFCITDGEHRIYNDQFLARFFLFVIDRQLSDGDNKEEIKSHSIDLLNDIIVQLEEDGFAINNVIFSSFDERFQASCSGAYAQVEIGFEREQCTDNNYPTMTEI